MANYLGYAQAFNSQGNPLAEGFNRLSDTVQQNRLMSLREATANKEMALREAEAAGAAESRGIQNRLSLANLNDIEAQRAGAMRASGAATPEEMYANQAIAEQQRQAQEQEAKGFQNYLNTIKALDEVKGIDATTKTLIGKEFLKKNPKYAAIADNLKYVDGKGVKAARQFAAGELKDPVTGQPLPAGYYETEGEWTGDPTNPVRLTNYKLVQEKPDQMDLLLKRDELQSQRDEKNRRAADARLEKTMSAQGNKPNPMDAMVAREAVKDIPKLRREAQSAEAAKTRIGQMVGLLDKGAAGGIKGNMLAAVSTFFDTPATSEADLFKKLASAGAGQLRASVIGPGPVSNYEQQLLQSVSGGGNGARTAIRQLMKYYQQEADRTINNYNDALESASTVAPAASKAFKPIGGKKPAGGKSAAKDPLGIL